MSNSKKYQYKITEDSPSCWSASIIRQVSSTKSNVSKTKGDFSTEAEAKKWAEAELAEFRQTQAQRNVRKNEQRKVNQSQREDRSNRKAAKTLAAKTQKADNENSSNNDVWKNKSLDSEEKSINDTSSNEETTKES